VKEAVDECLGNVALFSKRLLQHCFFERSSPACLKMLGHDLDQGFSNFWCYGAHEEIDHNLWSPTINF